MLNNNLIIDLDNTLADTDGALMQYLSDHSDEPISRNVLHEARKQPRMHYLSPVVSRFLRSPDLLGSVQPFHDALDAVQRLHDGGYRVHVVTARTDPSHDAALPWLKRHGYFKYITGLHQRTLPGRRVEFKVATAKALRPIAVFDDDKEVAEALDGLGFIVFLVGSVGPKTGAIVRTKTFATAVASFLETRGSGVATKSV